MNKRERKYWEEGRGTWEECLPNILKISNKLKMEKIAPWWKNICLSINT